MAGLCPHRRSDAELQQRIGAALREAGYELAAETEGVWAKRSIAVRRPDAVVLGTRLGDGDGFGLAEELRRELDTRVGADRLHRHHAPRGEPPRRGAAPVRPRRVPGDAARCPA